MEGRSEPLRGGVGLKDDEDERSLYESREKSGRPNRSQSESHLTVRVFGPFLKKTFVGDKVRDSHVRRELGYPTSPRLREEPFPLPLRHSFYAVLVLRLSIELFTGQWGRGR